MKGKEVPVNCCQINRNTRPPDRELAARFEKNPPNSKLCNSSETQQNTCDLDLDQMTFLLKLHLNIMVTCLHTKI